MRSPKTINYIEKNIFYMYSVSAKYYEKKIKLNLIFKKNLFQPFLKIRELDKKFYKRTETNFKNKLENSNSN